MQQKLLKMMMIIEGGMSKKKCLSSIFYSLKNKGVQESKDHQELSAAAQFIESELQEYPIIKTTHDSVRETVIRNKISSKVENDLGRQLGILTLKLQKQLTYLELQCLLELLPQMKPSQKQRNKVSLRSISSRIKNSLDSKLIKEDHVLEMAQKVFQQIQKELSRKSRQLS